ncbi:MAG: hypothetical protein K0M45_08175 [Candidatus Paracaedibacteraceae bacterium]|nr:hypothetical protein [Candidatus Paracaedibacteraceae bacterium]
MKNFLLQIKNYSLKGKEIYLKITLFYSSLSALIYLIQFQALEYMTFFLSKAIERPLPEDLINVLMRGIVRPDSQLEFIQKMGIYSAKILIDT